MLYPVKINNPSKNTVKMKFKAKKNSETIAKAYIITSICIFASCFSK